MTTVERSTVIAAPAERVWELVSDLPGMGRFSPEATGGRWVGGATGPAVGAVFVGTNRQGSRRWSTRARVVRCQPGREFAFAVSSVGLPVAEWSYALQPEDGGTRVTERWTDRRGGLISRVGALVTGVRDREQATGDSMERTLAAVRTAAEAG